MPISPPDKSSLDAAKAKLAHVSPPPDDELDPHIEALVNDLIARVADRWTMIILEVLA